MGTVKRIKDPGCQEMRPDGRADADPHFFVSISAQLKNIKRGMPKFEKRLIRRER